jgi:hypothetical protein
MNFIYYGRVKYLTTEFSKKAQRTQSKMSELGFLGLKDFGIEFLFLLIFVYLWTINNNP